MLCGALTLAMAGTLAALPRPAAACNNSVGSDRILAMAEDGSFVRMLRGAGGAFLETIAVIGPDGRDRASCMRVDDHSWECHGDRAFRVSPREPIEVLAKRWATLIAATEARVPAPLDVPLGVTEALCARLSTVWVGGLAVECERDNTTALQSPSSSLLFLREHVGPLPECGDRTEFDRLSWVSRDELARRLQARSALFKQRKRIELAAHADEARAWLLGDAGAAPPVTPTAP